MPSSFQKSASNTFYISETQRLWHFDDLIVCAADTALQDPAEWKHTQMKRFRTCLNRYNAH